MTSTRSTAEKFLPPLLSQARFDRYVLAAGPVGSPVDLYRWNVDPSGALHEALSFVEVIVRNSIDARLREWNVSQPARNGIPYDVEWVKRPAGPLYRLLNPKKRHGKGNHSTFTTEKRVLENRKLAGALHPRRDEPVTHDDVVAHLSFGKWVHLLPKPDDEPKNDRVVLWNRATHRAFPHRHVEEVKVIRYWMTTLHLVRNRVAHQEPLLDTDVRGAHRMAARLLRSIEPQVGDWYASMSRVPEVLKGRPC